MSRLIFSLLFILSISTTAYAGWTGPVEILSLTIGGGKNEIKIPPTCDDHCDPEWLFGYFYIIDERTVAILDNRTVKVFINSKLNRTFSIDPNKSTQFRGRFFEDGIYSFRSDTPPPKDRSFINAKHYLYKYDYNGNLVKKYDDLPDNIRDFWFADSKGDFVIWSVSDKYYLYDSDGTILIDYGNHEPPQLHIDSDSNKDGSVEISFIYNSDTYKYKADKSFREAVPKSYRGDDLFRIAIPPSKHKKYFHLIGQKVVTRTNLCGQIVGYLAIPEDVCFEGKSTGSRMDQITFCHDQYGWPIVDANGEVYSFKTSPKTFTILKWSWVDGPSDLKSDCSK